MVAALGQGREGRTADDLLGEAMLRILSGRRAWRKGACTFRQLVVGAMRSRVSHWAATAKLLPRTDWEAGASDGGDQDVLEGLPGDGPEPWRPMAAREERLARKRQYERLMKVFRGDAFISLLLKEKRKGKTHAELMARYGRLRYKTAMKRLFRQAREMAGSRALNGFDHDF